MCFSGLTVRRCVVAHRERVIPFDGTSRGTLVIKTTNYLAGGDVQVRTYTDPNPDVAYWLQGYQITDTESHPEWNFRKNGEFHGDIGGPFSTQKWHSDFVRTSGSTGGFQQVDVDPLIWPDGRQRHDATYGGVMLPLPPQFLSWPTVYPSSDDSLEEYGATAIARCSPSNPTVDLSVAVGELVKEGIPKLIGSTFGAWKSLSGRDRRRAVGQEYLNYEFGWKPLVNDFLDFCKSVVNAHETISAYERNSGKMVRRQYSFPEEKSTEIRVAATGVSPWHSPSSSVYSKSGSPGGVVYQTDEVSVRRWFRGAFSYYVPPPDGLRNKLAREVIFARKALGLSLTPDTLWNLAPWSWAIDWFSSTGDVISNWTDWAIDNQVLLYGYLMEHKMHRRTFTFTGDPGFQGGAVPCDVTKVCETKVRRQASPYGFGLTWDDLSTRQKAIAAALGVSRSK